MRPAHVFSSLFTYEDHDDPSPPASNSPPLLFFSPLNLPPFFFFPFFAFLTRMGSQARRSMST